MRTVLVFEGEEYELTKEEVCQQCGAAIKDWPPPLCEDCADRERLTPPGEI